MFHKSLLEVIIAIRLSEKSNKELLYLRFIFVDMGIRNKEGLTDNFCIGRNISFWLLYILNQIANKVDFG
jgi:hypothetical protein